MSAEDPQELPKIPALEGEYELLRELGRGGTAVVYLARERELGRYVAIKLIRPAYVRDDDAVARLVREARTVGKLQHPNIVMILGAKRLAGRELALILQYVPGITLKERIRTEGALPQADAERILRELGSALAYAHGHRIVHRDIKPENVYLDEESGSARLADFGIARVWDSDAGLTLPGSALGTPAYMSPEQVDGRDLDGRSDIFSLGLVGYEMLTGEAPWSGEGLYNIIYKQKHEELPPLADRCPGLPGRIRTAIEGALKKDPEERWRDANEFLAALSGSTASSADAAAGGLGGVGTGAGTDVPPTPPQVPPGPGLEDQKTIFYRPDAIEGEPQPAAHPAHSWARPPAWLRGRKGRRATGAYAGRGRSGNVPWEVPGELPPDDFDDDTAVAAGGPANPIIRRVVSVPGLIIVGLILLALGSLEVFSDGGYVRPLMASVRPMVNEYVRPVWTQLRSWTDGVAADGAQEAGAPRPSLGGPSQAGGLDSGQVSGAGEPLAPARLLILGGPLRTGRPGAELPGPVVVRVVDDAGEGVADIDVTFEVTTGSGSVQPARGVTGSEGVVMARWTLGGAVGLQRLRAEVPGAADGALIAELTAEAVGDMVAETEQEPPADAETPPMEELLEEADPPVAPVPVALELIRGSNQRTRPGATLPNPLEARVTGENGQPIASLPVRFAIISGGGSIAPARVDTDERGIARASWTLGPHEGPQLARAFVEGSPSLEVQFSADVGPSRLSVQHAVSAGGTHTCSLARNGSLECWGSNENGQLGDGSRQGMTSPGVEVPGGPYASVAMGVAHACALSRDGRLACWGLNGSGQLGDGSTTARSRPVPVAGNRRFASVSAGNSHTCALTAAGKAYCWGENDHGQLGDGSINRATTPVEVRTSLGFTQIAAGWNHTCALDGQGAAYCWGANDSGEAGAPSNRSPHSPSPVAGGNRFRSLAAGSRHTCGVTGQGRILCWGANDRGQLGDGVGRSRASPGPVADPNAFTAVAAGAIHSCGLTSSGAVRCWGGNVYGQLGNGSNADSLTPVPVASDVTFTQIHALGSHTCARTPNGNTFCWGFNVEGQLGDGTREDRNVPTPVVSGG